VSVVQAIEENSVDIEINIRLHDHALKDLGPFFVFFLLQKMYHNNINNVCTAKCMHEDSGCFTQRITVESRSIAF
jgi:hypothetical protein